MGSIICSRSKTQLARLAALSFLFTAQMFGQAISGTIVGTVRDSSGAVVTGAQVTATNSQTGNSLKAITGAGGDYTIPNVAPGTYELATQMTGFSTSVARNIVVLVQQTTRIDITLQPGATSQEITVSAEATLVQSTTSDLGQVIQAKQIQALPLNGRLFEQLVFTTPGAVQAGFGDFAENPSAAGSFGATNAIVNGLPWSGNYYMLDGVHNDEPLNAFISITPPLDSLDEFKVETSNPNAEYGSFGGAIINTVVKSGTNAFHGEAFNYLRNEDLNARDFFAQQRFPYKSNQFGGAVGGPIVRNKLFFFADYQQLIQHAGQTYLLSVPTPLQRLGILTEDGQPVIYDPLTGAPFPNNTIPPSRINPISQKVANLYPLPNLPGIANNYVTNTLNTQNVPQFDIKVDLQAGSNDHLFGRESAAWRTFDSPSPGNVFMMGGPNSNSLNQNAVAGWDHTFSANMVNQFRMGFNRFNVSDTANSYGIEENNALGIPNGNIPGLPYTSGIAQFNIPGYYSTGDPGWTDAQRIANIFEYTDNLTRTNGKHTLKFGADIQRIQSTLTNAQIDPRGVFNFDGNVTSGFGASAGNPIASFLLGYPASVDRDFVNTRPGVRMTFAGLYAQDDWRITNRLTINLGLRRDLFTRPVEAFNRQSNFEPATGLILVASPKNPGPNVDNYFGNWGPRIGLAYSPDNGKTAIRAAFGISYFPDNFGATGGTLERNYPFFTITTLINPNIYTPFRSVSDGLPAPLVVPYTPGGTLTPPPGFGVFFVAKNFRQDEAQVWNFSIQRQLPWNLVVTGAYVGTHGIHLYRDLQLNQTEPGPGPITPRLPFFAVAPNIPTVDQRNGDGYSRYNAAQFKVEKRLGEGFYLLASYTWSKTIDDISNIIYPYNDALNRGLSSDFTVLDIPQNLVVSYSYELPIGNGKSLLAGSSGLAGYLLQGWTVSGINVFQSGPPLPVFVASPALNNNGTINEADITCSHVPMPRTVNEWFDTGCFVNPPPYTFGNAGVGHIRAPGIINWDFSVAKAAPLSERLDLMFGADFFNILNTPHFSPPNNTLGTAAFGSITSDTPNSPRQIQVWAKIRF